MTLKCTAAWCCFYLLTIGLSAQSPAVGLEKRLIFHDIRTDRTGKILPWYNDDPGISYDFVLNAIWNYWKNMPGHWVRALHGKENLSWKKELKFPPKYLIFRTFEDQGIGGDQFAMMLSSWDLYYNYSGNPEVLKNMVFQADWYLNHGLSSTEAEWPSIPYPCNLEEAPVYDGDLILGKGFTQPDKAGSFGAELIMLYKKTGESRFLNAAIKIANTLAKHTHVGNFDQSPLPFKVHAETGEIKSRYTTNWVGTLRLFTDLMHLEQGDTASYRSAFQQISNWLKQFPIKNNRWGPFFEDIPVWSDTEINEGTMAWYILTHPDWAVNWKQDVRNMQDWAINTLGIDYWQQYGCKVMGEQSVYKVQGQSHTSRHASIELMYAAKTGDWSRKDEAIRQLNFCTYAVDVDGKSVWMNFDTYELWWSDGYGDFARHLIRAMAAAPELAPANQHHLLHSSSVVKSITYSNDKVNYLTFDGQSEEIIRTHSKPKFVWIEGKKTQEVHKQGQVGYYWERLKIGGVVHLKKDQGKKVMLEF